MLYSSVFLLMVTYTGANGEKTAVDMLEQNAFYEGGSYMQLQKLLGEMIGKPHPKVRISQ